METGKDIHRNGVRAMAEVLNELKLDYGCLSDRL